MVRSGFAAGFILSLFSAFFWGTTFLAGRSLMRDGAIDPISLSFFRFAGAGALMFAAGLRLKGRAMFELDCRTLITILLQGTVGMAAMSCFVFWGQETTSAVNSSTIMASIPVMVMLAGLFLGEKIRPIQYFGMAVATAGCLVVIRIIEPNGIHFDTANRGDLLIFGAAICWAIYTLWGRRTVQKVDGYIYTTYAMLGAVPALLLIGALKYTDIKWPTAAHDWLLVGYLVLFPTAIAFWAWNMAQRRLSLPLLNIMQYLSPVTVLALSWPLLGEGVSLFQLAGALLVIFGVGIDPALLDEWKRRKRQSCSNPLIPS